LAYEWSGRSNGYEVPGLLVAIHYIDNLLQSRPFGVSLLIGGFDEKGPQLYVAEEPRFLYIESG
jgi:hypothetical protein